MRLDLAHIRLLALLLWAVLLDTVPAVLASTDGINRFVTPEDGAVLVLGSGGLIGRALVQSLKKEGYRVLEVVNRKHIDLREPNALDQFDDQGKTSFVFFLACEVGGSKFLDSDDGQVQKRIIESNLKIYQTVFSWLDRRRIPFIFTSSYLQNQDTSYGTIKRLGEKWMAALDLGRVARLWNVYGLEAVGLRSHVITDWVAMCLHDGHIACKTNGRENRQFVYVDDCATALIEMMHSYKALDFITDLSSGIWLPIRQVAETIVSLSPRRCVVHYSTKEAVAREFLAPDMTQAFHERWKASISLEEGIARIYEDFTRIGYENLVDAEEPGEFAGTASCEERAGNQHYKQEL